ncbi:palmitoyltransferase pfa4 [Histoplasma capsulatum G186AR]|uniref:Palmitoyltransferase PFA4 n=1 Tax=Ajellomyces capsulatus TaxID=5037 RepID=A0A8H7YAD0_AJECA|nr:palmitoyltransferase pfa4 [Histoplasma capsulatum]QSS70464.1 palmitoyltransferase pfa4 [Histoplasma capsulatum G186AR]
MMVSFNISCLAIPAVSFLVAFLAYSSQYIFLYLEPSPPSKDQLIKFNALVACLWICYYRACTTDPGQVPAGWQPPVAKNALDTRGAARNNTQYSSYRQRWCQRCDSFKPPRAHHCKTCQRCIPKMDHHCPWTENCVSHFTLPHFIRFLFYAVGSMTYLEYLLYPRVVVIWNNRHLPSYLGPSLPQLVHLLLLVVLNSMVLFALIILLARTLWCLGGNTTTIEVWEIERHKTLLRRARMFGGHLEGPGGVRVRIQKQEFPYDIGIWRNLKSGMGGSANIIGWFWPFASTPCQGSGLEFEVNGFEESTLSWPPPDPDRMYKPMPRNNYGSGFTHEQNYISQSQEVEAFKLRQREDFRRQQAASEVQRRRPFHKRYMQNVGMTDFPDLSESESGENSDSGEEGWRDSEGDRLRDFGVDEEVEFYDEDNIPLAELLRRRKSHTRASM